MFYPNVAEGMRQEHLQDHVHPNDEGYAIISRKLVDFLLDQKVLEVESAKR